MKISKIVTPKDLKEIAANIREIAATLEANKNLQYLQSASLKTKKVKGRLDLDIAIKFSLVEEGEIKEVGKIVEGLNNAAC